MSDVKKVPIAEATYVQLKDFATLSLGLEVKNGLHKQHVIALIEQVQPGITEIDLVDDASAVQARGAEPGQTVTPNAPVTASPADSEIPEGRAGGHFRYDPKVGIRIEAGRANGRKDVQLSVNGATITVLRGVDVEIPYRFYQALMQARETVFEETGETDPATGQPIRAEVERHTIPFSLTGVMPSAEEIKAFHARTDALSL